jgi:hypothetical protein
MDLWSVIDVSEVHAASVFRVDVCRVDEFPYTYVFVPAEPRGEYNFDFLLLLSDTYLNAATFPNDLLKLKKLNSVALIRERTIPTERPPLVGKVVPTFADRGCRVVSATDSHGR